MLKYMKPALSAEKTMPMVVAPRGPNIARKSGLYELASRSDSVLSKVPEVTPRGNPTKLGVGVMTPVTPGAWTQQWMCAAVVGPVRSLKLACTCRFSEASNVTVARPVAGEAF